LSYYSATYIGWLLYTFHINVFFVVFGGSPVVLRVLRSLEKFKNSQGRLDTSLHYINPTVTWLILGWRSYSVGDQNCKLSLLVYFLDHFESLEKKSESISDQSDLEIVQKLDQTRKLAFPSWPKVSIFLKFQTLKRKPQITFAIVPGFKFWNIPTPKTFPG
jgi:hypothetical protein